MNRFKSASIIFVSIAFMASVVVNPPIIQTNATTVTLNENERVVNIELGGFFSIAMTNQNRIFSWGRNDRGQLGVASPSTSNVPINITSRFPLNAEETIVDIKLGFEHALALSSTGRVFSWGSSNASENSFSFNLTIPTVITGITFNAGEVATKIAAGGNTSMVLTSENRLFAFGNGEAGQIVGSSSSNAPKNISSSFTLNAGETFVDIELGSFHSSVITSNNRVFMMGNNLSGQLGNDYQGGNFSRSPVDITSNIPVSPNGVTKAFLGHEHSVLFAPVTGNAFVFGTNSSAALGTNAFSQSVPANMAQNVASGENIITAIDAGFRHGAALRTDQQFFIWGSNGWGEVSLPTANANQKLPINITDKFNLFDGETIIDFSLGGGQSGQGAVQGAHTGIVTSLGRVFMFGSNSFGQLGIGTTAADVSTLNASINTVALISVSFDPTITFDVNGGSEVALIKLPEGTAINAPTNPTKLGYTFDGWFTDSALTNAFTFSTMPSEDTTLFAKWAVQPYTISYELNGGINAVSNPASFNITTPTITLDNPTKVGHTFFAWYNNPGFTGSAITSIPLGTTGNQTLHAKYDVNQYTITFDTNEGSLVSPITQNFDSLVSQPTAPTKALFTFAGWFSDEALSSPYTFTKMPAADITLYAKWTLNQYTITFNTGGGSNVNPITQDYGTNVTTPNNPTRSGYDFSGWYSDSLLTSPYTFTTIPGNDITIYAKWTPVIYTINFVLNGGTIGSNQITSYSVTSDEVILVPATRDGHVFKGYYQEATFQTLITSINPNQASTLTVYALFFTTSFDAFYQQVNDLPNPLTIQDKPLITSYLATYNTLSTFEKSFIDLPALESALSTILMLEVTAVINGINAINDPLTLSDEDQVIEAREAYDDLSANQQALVTNYQDLIHAENQINLLKQQAVNEEEAEEIITTITTLPEVDDLTLEDEASIIEARQAYDALTPEQKALVTNYQSLVAAEARIVLLRKQFNDLTAANSVVALIDALPSVDAVTLNDRTRVIAARASYDNLTVDQKTLVANYQVLVDVELQITALIQEQNNSTLLLWLFIGLMLIISGGLAFWFLVFKKNKKEKEKPANLANDKVNKPNQQ